MDDNANRRQKRIREAIDINNTVNIPSLQERNTRRLVDSIHYPPPERVWEQGRNGLWHSREWLPGERKRYQEEVLGW